MMSGFDRDELVQLRKQGFGFDELAFLFECRGYDPPPHHSAWSAEAVWDLSGEGSTSRPAGDQES